MKNLYRGYTLYAWIKEPSESNPEASWVPMAFGDKSFVMFQAKHDNPDKVYPVRIGYVERDSHYLAAIHSLQSPAWETSEKALQAIQEAVDYCLDAIQGLRKTGRQTIVRFR